MENIEELCENGLIDPEDCCRHINYDKIFKDPKDCTKFFICDENEALQYQCDEGMMYSSDVASCIEADSTCLMENEDQFKKKCKEGKIDAELCCQQFPRYSFTFLKNPKDCRSYYVCFNHRVGRMKCPFRFHWSVKYNMCLFPRFAKCTIDQPPEGSASEESSNSYENNSSEESTTPNTRYV